MAALVCFLTPTLALAGALSAGNLATSSVPSMPAAPAGGGGQGGGAVGSGTLVDSFGAYADLNERYSTNANGSSAAPQSDVDTRFDLGVNASKSTQRLNASLNYTFGLDYFANESSDVTISNFLNASATADVITDHLLVQATAFASPVYVSRLGNVAPAGVALPPGSNGDVRNNYGFSVQPVLSFRLGDFLRSDTIFSYSAYYFDQQNGGASVPLGLAAPDFDDTRSVTERLSTGDYFSQVQLGITGSYSEQGQGTGGLIQKSAMADISYAINHDVSVVGNAGYQTVQAAVPFQNPLNGPIFMAGLQFNFARLSGQFRVGEQYHSFSGTGSLNYQITPRLNVSATAQDGVSTPEANLFTPGLVNLLLNDIATGQIQIPSSGILTVGDLLGAIGLNNSIARFRMETVSLSFAPDDFTLSVGGYDTSQDTETPVPTGQNGDLDTIGVYANISHQFGNGLSANFSTSYHTDALQIGGASDVEFSLSGSYALGQTIQLYAEADYFERLSNSALAAASPDSGSLSTTSISLGIRYHFL